MSDLIERLESYDEGSPPADGWYIAYDDLQEAAKALREQDARIAELEDALRAIKANADPKAISLSPKRRIQAFFVIASKALEGEK